MDPETKIFNSMNLVFPTPDLQNEFNSLPSPVKSFALSLQDFSTFRWVVTSIKTDYRGNERTIENGPNHHQGIAVDMAPDFHYESIHSKQDAPTNYNRLPLLMKTVLKAYILADRPNVRVVIESDHLHIDTNLAHNLPGVYIYTVNRQKEIGRDPICKFNKNEIVSVVPILKLMNLI